jgi:hypothetical protein
LNTPLTVHIRWKWLPSGKGPPGCGLSALRQPRRQTSEFGFFLASLEKEEGTRFSNSRPCEISRLCQISRLCEIEKNERLERRDSPPVRAEIDWYGTIPIASARTRGDIVMVFSHPACRFNLLCGLSFSPHLCGKNHFFSYVNSGGQGAAALNRLLRHSVETRADRLPPGHGAVAKSKVGKEVTTAFVNGVSG